MPAPQKYSRWTDQGPHNQWRKPDNTIDYELMLSKNNGLILWAIRRAGFKGDFESEYIENIIQELKVHLCRVAECFDPTLAKWSTYASIAMMRRISHIKKIARRPENHSFLISDLDGEPLMVRPGTHKSINTIENLDFITYLIDGLPKREEFVVRQYYLCGLKYAEIGALLDPPVGRERVRQILDRAILRMRSDTRNQGFITSPLKKHTRRTNG